MKIFRRLMNGGESGKRRDGASDIDTDMQPNIITAEGVLAKYRIRFAEEANRLGEWEVEDLVMEHGTLSEVFAICRRWWFSPATAHSEAGRQLYAYGELSDHTRRRLPRWPLSQQIIDCTESLLELYVDTSIVAEVGVPSSLALYFAREVDSAIQAAESTIIRVHAAAQALNDTDVMLQLENRVWVKAKEQDLHEPPITTVQLQEVLNHERERVVLLNKAACDALDALSDLITNTREQAAMQALSGKVSDSNTLDTVSVRLQVLGDVARELFG